MPNAARMPGSGRVLARLFYEFFRIALFVVGGGYAIIVVADDVFAHKLKWTAEGEILSQLPVFQMVPGLIAGNTAIYVGLKMAGVLGAAVALVAVALPSIGVFLAVTLCYGLLPLENSRLAGAFLGLRSALAGVIAWTIIRGWKGCVCGPVDGAVAFLAAVALLWFGANPALVLVGAMAFGLVRAGVAKGKFMSIGAVPLVFLKYGLLAFGGGFVLVPMYVRDFVGGTAPYVQMSHADFSNLMSLTQMTPGPVSINAATFFGYHMAGVPGAILATLCLLLPSFFLLTWALRSLEKWKTSRIVKGILVGARPATVALLASAFWTFAGMSIWEASPDGFVFRPLALAVAGFAVCALVSRCLSVMQLVVVASIFGLRFFG